MTPRPKLYMAGKIEHNCWRHQFVPGLRGAEWNSSLSAFDPRLTLQCPEFTYVGPFFIACDHGCGHGPNTHGVNGTACTDTGGLPIHRGQAVVLSSFARIERADVVFAWIDKADCYGTLVELGYARALGKFIAIQFLDALMPTMGYEPNFGPVEKGFDVPENDAAGRFDMWFAAEMANCVAVLPKPDPLSVVWAWQDHRERNSVVTAIRRVGRSGMVSKGGTA